MKLANFCKGMRVRCVPNHAYGDRNHSDCKEGVVSSVNHKYVFVKFYKRASKLGGYAKPTTQTVVQTTAQSCHVDNLIIITYPRYFIFNSKLYDGTYKRYYRRDEVGGELIQIYDDFSLSCSGITLTEGWIEVTAEELALII